MTCYTVTTCVFSGGSRPSDKGGGGEVIQTLSPEIRGGGWAVSKKFGPKKKDEGGGGAGRHRPFPWIRHCYIVTQGSLSSSRFQARWASIGPRH